MSNTNFSIFEPSLQDQSVSRVPLRVLFHSDLLISHFAARKSHNSKEILKLISLVLSGEILGFLTSFGYQAIRVLVNECLQEHANLLLEFIEEKFRVCEIEQKFLREAIGRSQLSLEGFESIQISCAQRNQVDYIVLENNQVSNFSSSGIETLTPFEFNSRYSSEDQCVRNEGRLSPYATSSLGFVPGRINRLDDDDFLEVVPGWQIEHYEVHLYSKEQARAELWLSSLSGGERVFGRAYGNGPTHSVCNALAVALSKINPNYELPLAIVTYLVLESDGRGADSPVHAQVTVHVDSSQYTGTFVHTDTIRAVFYAYLRALRESNESQATALEKDQVITSAQELNRLYQANCIPREATLKGMEEDFGKYEGIILARAKISNCFFQRCVFSSQAHRANFDRVYIYLSDFQKSDFSHADFRNANIASSTFNGANFCHANLSDSVFHGMELNDANFEGANLRRTHFSACRFENAHFHKAEFHMAILSWVNFKGVNLQNASFEQAILTGADLSNADLSKTRWTKANLSRANLHKVILLDSILDEANFANANLSDAILRKCDLSSAILDGANLTGANLNDATLRDCDLRSVTLDGADLTQADLSGADLRGLDLTTVNLTGVLLDGAKLDETMLTPVQKTTLLAQKRQKQTYGLREG